MFFILLDLFAESSQQKTYVHSAGSVPAWLPESCASPFSGFRPYCYFTKLEGFTRQVKGGVFWQLDQWFRGSGSGLGT
jgi:hypothetical protein